jgi:hypothetical protein
VGEAMALAVTAESSPLTPRLTVQPVAMQRAAKILPAPTRPLESARPVEIARPAEIEENTPEIQPAVVGSSPLLSYTAQSNSAALAQFRVGLARLRVGLQKFRGGLEQFGLSTLAFWQQAKHIPAYKRSRISGLVTACVVGTFAWMMLADRPAISSSLPKAAQQMTNSVTQPSTVPAQPPNVDTSLPKTTSPTPRRTLNRNYASTTNSQDSPYSDNSVKHFGSDVTVRYFAPRPVVLKVKPKDRVRKVSEDVTVRYFGPQDTAMQPPLESGHRTPLNR